MLEDIEDLEEADEETGKKKFKPLGGGWHKVAIDAGNTIESTHAGLRACRRKCKHNSNCHSLVQCPHTNVCLLSDARYSGDEGTKHDDHCQTWYDPTAYKETYYTQCKKGTVPKDGNCVAASEPTQMTFYQYSAQDKYDPDRVWENVDMASLGGVLFYLHNEVVDKKGEMLSEDGKRTPKFGIDRVVRFKVTMHNTNALWKDFKSQFGQFIQFDYGQATFGMPDHVKKCNAIWEKYGYEVGCQATPTGVSGYTDGYWTSWPGKCPSMPFKDNTPQGGPKKTSSCEASQPGGSCKSPDGTPDCTWRIEPAGYVTLDELTGVNVEELLGSGGHLYNDALDSGENLGAAPGGEPTTDFWKDKKDPEACRERETKLLSLFAKKYPSQNASLPDPPCDFWR